MTGVEVREENGKFKIFDDGICYDAAPTKVEAYRIAALLRDYYVFIEEITNVVKKLLEKRTPEQRKMIHDLTLGFFKISV